MRPTDTDALRASAVPPPLDGRAIHVWLHDTAQSRPRAVREAARAMLEHLLRGYAGGERTPRVECGAHGKPFAPALPWLDFNLSHAGSCVALAFAREQPLGIDIEPLDRRVCVDGIATRFFSAREAAALERVEPSRRHLAFLHLWTHKEAVLKALGDGLGFGLERIEFELSAEGRVDRLAHVAAEAGSPADWRLWPLEAAAGITGCLAWHGAARAVQRLQFVS